MLSVSSNLVWFDVFGILQEAGFAKQEQSFQRRLVEAKEQSDRRWVKLEEYRPSFLFLKKLFLGCMYCLKCRSTYAEHGVSSRLLETGKGG